MDEAIRLLRAYWSDAEVSFESAHYPTVAMAMEPKPPQGGRLPIWIGGNSEAAYRRVGRLGDGWLAQPRRRTRPARGRPSRPFAATPRRPAAIPAPSGCRAWWPPRPATRPARASTRTTTPCWRRVAALKAMGFGWVTLNATAIFQAGARSVDAIIDSLARLHDRIRAEIG